MVAIGVAIPARAADRSCGRRTSASGPTGLIFWRGAVDVWLIGHGVDVTFTLDPTTAAALGIAGRGRPGRRHDRAARIRAAHAAARRARGRARRRVRAPRARRAERRSPSFALLSLGVTLTAVHRCRPPVDLAGRAAADAGLRARARGSAAARADRDAGPDAGWRPAPGRGWTRRLADRGARAGVRRPARRERPPSPSSLSSAPSPSPPC